MHLQEYYADLEYSSEGKLIITKSIPFLSAPFCSSHMQRRKHDPVPLDSVRARVSVLFYCRHV